MGQYWEVVVISDQEYTYHDLNNHIDIVHKEPRCLAIDPRDFGGGTKLTEHAFYGNDVPETVVDLLVDAEKNPPDAGDSNFVGLRVAWVGDYASEEDFKEDVYPKQLYREAWKKRKNVVFSDLPKGFFAKKEEKTRAGQPEIFILCPELKEYIFLSPADAYKEGVWYLHPLPLLCAIGNGRGGGDFGGKDPHKTIGRWALRPLRVAHSVDGLGEYNDISHLVPDEEDRGSRS